jgi:hypothetical protein
MAFGKRSVAVAMPATSVPVETSPVVTADLVKGDGGGGFADVDIRREEANASDAAVNALVAADRARQDAQLARLNGEADERVAGGRMRMFLLLPETCWQGDMGAFFMKRLGFSPYGDWNVVFMAADERTAQAMNVPVHPGGPIPGTVELIEQFVREFHERLEVARAAAERSGRHAGYAATEHEVKADVWGLASYLAGKNGVAFRPSF